MLAACAAAGSRQLSARRQLRSSSARYAPLCGGAAAVRECCCQLPLLRRRDAAAAPALARCQALLPDAAVLLARADAASACSAALHVSPSPAPFSPDERIIITSISQLS